MTTSEKILMIVATELRTAPDDMTLDSSLEDLGADSVELLEIALAIEAEFGIDVPDASAKRFRTVKDIITYVSRRLQGT